MHGYICGENAIMNKHHINWKDIRSNHDRQAKEEVTSYLVSCSWKGKYNINQEMRFMCRSKKFGI